MAVLGLDLGDRRVGVAISRSGIIAEPLMTLEFNELFFIKIKELCEVRGIKKIIVGLPKSLKGIQNEQERKIKETAQKIAKYCKKEVILIDERFTTKLAKQRVKKDKIDEESAVIILQSYLDKSK